MKPEDIEKLQLDCGEARDLHTGKPFVCTVRGLPLHLEVKISGGQQGYQYHLTRAGDVVKYDQCQFSNSPEEAFKALKRLLKWDPII